ncbi:nicotinate-nucleotide--dimethylbenzimidazole phosphoribosyltransferase [Streptomyces sp. CA-249302]|uniref:nicotinate-nucleotide--dimethylbenzimidazole phosphoribosyltransferase n=1 Tax=Streptomyces sp. CA-249302 TaxID=3240058 RepID=UPI003D8C26EC
MQAAEAAGAAYGPQSGQVPVGVSAESGQFAVGSAGLAAEGGQLPPLGLGADVRQAAAGELLADGGRVAVGGLAAAGDAVPPGGLVAADGPVGSTGGSADSGQGTGSASTPAADADLIQAVGAGPDAEAVVGVETAPEAGQGPHGGPVFEAGPAPEAGQASDAVPLPGAVHTPEAAPAPEGAQADEAAVPETGQAPEAVALGSGQAPEAVALGSGQVAEAVVPETGQVTEAVLPESGQFLDAVAPDAAQLPDAAQSAHFPEALSPEAVQVPGAGAADAPLTPEPVAPHAVDVPEAPVADADGPTAAHAIAVDPAYLAAAESAQAADIVVPAQAPGTAVPAEATPFPPAPDATQPAHPADALTALPEDASVAAGAEHAHEDPALSPVAAAQPALDAEPPANAPAAVLAPDSSATDPATTAVPDAPQPLAAGNVPDAAVAPTEDQPVLAPESAALPLAADAPEQPVAAPAEASATPADAPADPHPEAPAETLGELPAEIVAEAPTEPMSQTPLSHPEPDQSLGQFVPVAGSVPTTPHLAPTPPHPLTLPPEEEPAVEPVGAMVPAPREADIELVQHAEDLETRAADQEESTAAVEEARQSTGPAAPAYDDAEREAVLKVMRERRDIRNGFRSDPIPHEVLLRVLEAAHTAPSVGHSQPWDFVVIRSADTRRSMHELAMRQRDAYAKSLPKGRAKQFKELKIEAILDTPVNIVVTADPTRGGRHTLGRHTQPQMAPYSAALAVENLWLAARAEGLGVGWVSFFDEREMVRALGLPEHLEVIAYLCVGYVDEFPDEPELMQAGWSKRRPLSWVVHEETYGRRALPGEDPHDLLAETVAQIRPLDAKALGEAWERQKRMTKPAGALGMLEIISAQLSGLSRQCPPPIPEPAAVAIFAGDHGVHAQGVTPWPQEVTAQMVANFLGGGAVCNAFAGQVGAEVCVVDVGVAAELPATPGLLPRKVRAGTSDMTTGPAMTREEAQQAIEVGIETARDLVAAGNKALLTGEMGIANTTASAALISVYTDTDPAEVTGRGTGINDETLARKTEVVRRAIELHRPDPADPIGVLAAIGGFEHAAMVGLLLGGASLRTPVILDGVSAGAAALVARAIAPEVLAACIAGHRSAEPGHVAALNKLGLRPLVDLDLRLGEGTGALLALPLVQSTARAMHEVATFDSAGVTEK